MLNDPALQLVTLGTANSHVRLWDVKPTLEADLDAAIWCLSAAASGGSHMLPTVRGFIWAVSFHPKCPPKAGAAWRRQWPLSNLASLNVALRYVHEFRKGLSSSMRQDLREFYAVYPLDRLVAELRSPDKVYEWSHQDIIRMIHLNPLGMAQERPRSPDQIAQRKWIFDYINGNVRPADPAAPVSLLAKHLLEHGKLSEGMKEKLAARHSLIAPTELDYMGLPEEKLLAILREGAIYSEVLFLKVWEAAIARKVVTDKNIEELLTSLGFLALPNKSKPTRPPDAQLFAPILTFPPGRGPTNTQLREATEAPVRYLDHQVSWMGLLAMLGQLGPDKKGDIAKYTKQALVNRLAGYTSAHVAKNITVLVDHGPHMTKGFVVGLPNIRPEIAASSLGVILERGGAKVLYGKDGEKRTKHLGHSKMELELFITSRLTNDERAALIDHFMAQSSGQLIILYLVSKGPCAAVKAFAPQPRLLEVYGLLATSFPDLVRLMSKLGKKQIEAANGSDLMAAAYIKSGRIPRRALRRTNEI